MYRAGMISGLQTGMHGGFGSFCYSLLSYCMFGLV